MSVPEAERFLAGRYRLRAVIGRGGMGVVWRARDEMLNRDVAVKEVIWPPEIQEAERETVRRRALREAQMAARLHHQNVVGVYDIFEDDGRPVIVMELLPFGSLRDTLGEGGPLPPARVARIGLGVLAGLRAAHEAGVIHRDVKPANIMLGPEDRVVLTDFGIAKATDSEALTTAGILIGSPSFLAPERARGEQAGAAADLWGLGASLYTAVEGRPPFERPGALASLTAVVADEPDPYRHAGPLEPVISGLLRKDPGARLSTAEAEQMLRGVLEQHTPGPESAAAAVPAEPSADAEPASSLDTLLAPRTPPVRRSTRRRFRGPWAAVIAVLGIAVITAAVAWAVSQTPGHPAAGQPDGTLTRSPASAATRASGPASAPPSAAPSSAAPSSAAPSSAAPSSAAPSSAAPARAGSPTATGGGASPVPSGYYRFTNSTGFSIGVPAGWQIQHVGHYVYIRDPADGGIFLLIDQSDQPQPNPLADWQQQAAARQGSYPGYHLIRLAAVSYPQAEKAADWEFTYDRNGVEVEVLNRNVLANAQHAYALYWSTPVSVWNAYYHYFQVFAATFQPAS